LLGALKADVTVKHTEGLGPKPREILTRPGPLDRTDAQMQVVIVDRRRPCLGSRRVDGSALGDR